MPSDFILLKNRRAWAKALLGPMDEAKWSELARELFAWQFERVPAYRRLCETHGVTPEKLTFWQDIPAVPQQLFKLEKLFAYESAKPMAIYETSGTTTGQPGRQHLLETDIYRAVSVEGACRAGLTVAAVGSTAVRHPADGGYLKTGPQLHFLVASPREVPHSSLSAMFGFWQMASNQTGRRFWMKNGNFDFSGLREKLEKEIKTGRAIGLAGTAFSFVHLIDAWGDLPPLKFPRGSWLLETGGFKGRSREVSKAELYAQLSRTFSVPDHAIWNEYGMSELSSQAYAQGVTGLHQTPPWARVRVVNPANGREVRLGQKGLIRWIDLANVDSVLALQTLDLAERTPSGFRLIGRLPKTEPRGCSLSAEDLAVSTELAASSS